jgi:hypothetical protein
MAWSHLGPSRAAPTGQFGAAVAGQMRLVVMSAHGTANSTLGMWGRVVRSWPGLRCGAQRLAELNIGDAGRVSGLQSDCALARRQRGLAGGVIRRRGDYGKRFALDLTGLGGGTSGSGPR